MLAMFAWDVMRVPPTDVCRVWRSDSIYLTCAVVYSIRHRSASTKRGTKQRTSMMLAWLCVQRGVGSKLSYIALPSANCVMTFLRPPWNRCATGCGGRREAARGTVLPKYSTTELWSSKNNDWEKPAVSHASTPLGMVADMCRFTGMRSLT
jgi:hypothetical protein